jgi:hypothetical protein
MLTVAVLGGDEQGRHTALGQSSTASLVRIARAGRSRYWNNSAELRSLPLLPPTTST